jgi:hypothetical protein
METDYLYEEKLRMEERRREDLAWERELWKDAFFAFWPEGEKPHEGNYKIAVSFADQVLEDHRKRFQ